MPSFPGANYLRDSARTEQEMKDAFEAWLAATKQLPGGTPLTPLTLASGQITPTGPLAVVDTQGGASTDNLAQILQTNLPDGSWLMLGVTTNARAVVVKHAAGGTGQITLVGAVDFTMNDITQTLLLERTGALWQERGRWYGANSAAFRTFYQVAGLGQNRFTGRQEWNRGADLVAAATLTPGTDGNFFWVTGTTGITAIAAMPAGTRILLGFASGVALTHSANLSLVGALSRTTTPNESSEFVATGSGSWYEVGGGGGGAAMLGQANVNVTIPSTSVETFVWSVTVPGGTLGTASSVRMTASGYVNGAPPASTGPVQLLFKLYYGGTNMAGLVIALANVGALPNGTSFRLEAIVHGWGATNSQLAQMTYTSALVMVDSGILLGAGYYNVGYAWSGRGGASINSTVDQVLQLNGQLPNGGTCVVEHLMLQKMRP